MSHDAHELEIFAFETPSNEDRTGSSESTERAKTHYPLQDVYHCFLLPSIIIVYYVIQVYNMYSEKQRLSPFKNLALVLFS